MSLTPKQQLEQVNNPNLLSILSTIQGLPSQESLKQGAYVWKKLTSEGGDFIDFVVSDSETAYPDGGMQDGYWYERVVEGVSGIDYGTFSTQSYKAQITVEHNLGVVPSHVYLIRIPAIVYNSYTSNQLDGWAQYKTSNTVNQISVENEKTATSVTFKPDSSYKFMYGDYYWIVIA